MVTAYPPLNATCPHTNFENYVQIVQNQEFSSKEWNDVVFRLGFCGARAVSMLKKALDALNKLAASNSPDSFDTEGNKRWYIIKALEQIGKDAKDAVPELTAILENEKLDDYLQYHTVNALGKIGSEAKFAIPTLRKLLTVESSDFIIQVTKALGLIGETEFAVSKLLETIKTTTTVRLGEQAVLALAEIVPDTSGITNSLVEIIQQKDESNESRVSAALGLFAIGIKLEDTSSTLVEILENEQNSAVLISTALALLTGNGDKTAIVRAIEKSIDYLSKESTAWEYYDGGDPLRELQLTVAKAVRADMKVTVSSFVDILVDKADTTENLRMRERVVEILGAIGAEASGAVPALIEIVKHKNEEIVLRERAITTLGAIGSEARDSINQLIQVVEDEQEELDIRSAAVTALGKIGVDAKSATPILLKVLIEDFITKDTNTNNDDYAHRNLVILSAEALSKLGETKLAVNYLLKIVKENRELREVLIDSEEVNYNRVNFLKFHSIRGVGFAFQRIGLTAVSFLITALNNSNLQRLTALLDLDSDLQQRRAAAYGLAMIGQLPNEAIDILIAVVNNEREDLDVRRLAAYALENSGIDVQEFFNKVNLVPASKAVCRHEEDFFDIYLGLCIGVPKNGGAALLEWIKKKLGG